MITSRIDYVLSGYVSRWLSLLTGAAHGARIPILMYHSVSSDGQSRGHHYYDLHTTRQTFTDQMALLREYNFTVVSLADAVRRLSGQIGSAEKCAVITFDDGYRDVYQHAFPVLRERGYPSTMFLPTNFIANRRRVLNGRDCLTWQEVREMLTGGMTFGAHTTSHAHLEPMPVADVEHEIQGSKQAIEDALGVRVDAFSCPYAFPEANRSFIQVLRRILERHGFSHGVSTILGRARPSDDRYFLRRLPVNSWDDRRLFSAKLEGGYDWMHVPQYASKMFRRGFQRQPIRESE